jgi:hypothetical protein
MLKSTAIKIMQNDCMIEAEQRTAAAIEKQNAIYREEVEETKRHNKSEEETKDRVNISKKEYLELLEDREALKRRDATLEKMLMPLCKFKIPEKAVQDILDSKFEVDVRVQQRPAECTTKNHHVF